jgi:hypothetical protein
MNIFASAQVAAKFVLMLAALAGLVIIGRAQADVVINPNFPIRGPNNLSPPYLLGTFECSTHVYVTSFVPGATIMVYVSGSTLVGGPIAPPFGFSAIPLTRPLKAGEMVTATQTVNGVTSQPSTPPMVVEIMPPTLPPPQVGKDIYACGRIVPVHGLTSGVTVEVRDKTTGSVIGTGFTPNDWGIDWDPVLTSPLQNGHMIDARQAACTGAMSGYSGAEPVNADPSPLPSPLLDPFLVGNDALTAHHLLTGSFVQFFQGPVIAQGHSTGETNTAHVSPRLAAPPPSPTVTQALCPGIPPSSSPPSQVTRLSPPMLVSPICTGNRWAVVADTTINAALVLLKNGAIVGYGGAAPGDVLISVAPPASFQQNDQVQVAEYIGGDVAMSNIVKVGCGGGNGGSCLGGAECMCKPGGICNSGFTCVAGTCVACGQYSKQCCPGNTCSSGLTCQYSPAQNSYTCLP